MKIITIIITALIFVVVLTSLCFAADELQIKGIVTRINGSQITIKDNQGKETTVAGNAHSIKVGDKVLVSVIIYLQDHQRDLTSGEIDFLTKQCLIDRADVDMIKQLSNNAQASIIKWIAAQDCKKFTPFKSTRYYYSQLKPGVKLPTPPAVWDFDWLTDEEYLRYVDILNKAPL